MLVGDRMTDGSGTVQELRGIRNGDFNRDLPVAWRVYVHIVPHRLPQYVPSL